MKHSFRNDYSEIGHPKILDALTQCENEQNPGYGVDKHVKNAENLIKDFFGLEKGSVFFLVGGSQTNMVVISFLLRSYEGVIAEASSSINTREAACVEGSGHKIYTIAGVDGKLTPELINTSLKTNESFHQVKLRMLFLSNPTGKGAQYKKKELEEIYKICKENDLILFIDGSRLAASLTSPENDMSPKEFASLCDIFYIGGGNCGLLFGEAVVFKNEALSDCFRFHVKNKGAMVAKGFILGIEFETLFKNNLFLDLGKHQNECVALLKGYLLKKGIKFYHNSTTNQLYPIFKRPIAEKLKEMYDIDISEEVGDEVVGRFLFSWNTKIEAIKELIADLEKIL